jgi:hypothetical protein
MNANGDVLWVAFMPNSNDEIFWYDNEANTVYQIVNETCDDYDPDFNDNADIVWSMSCAGFDREIILFDNDSGTASPFTNNTWDDHSARINNKGDIVWKSYDSGATDKYDVNVFSASTGDTDLLVKSPYEQYHVDINNNGQIVWQVQFGTLGSDTVEIFLATPEVPACVGDFSPPDGDVDGEDLYQYILNNQGISVYDFCSCFGRNDCP